MVSDDSWTAQPRSERELRGRWGLYSTRHDRWLDVVFMSELEAVEMRAILLRGA